MRLVSNAMHTKVNVSGTCPCNMSSCMADQTQSGLPYGRPDSVQTQTKDLIWQTRLSPHDLYEQQHKEMQTKNGGKESGRE